MTEEELNYLFDLKDKFWDEFSDLCNRYIAQVQREHPSLVDHATMMLGESTSIYGRKTQ